MKGIAQEAISEWYSREMAKRLNAATKTFDPYCEMRTIVGNLMFGPSFPPALKSDHGCPFVQE
jgi:hypothetical protein